MTAAELMNQLIPTAALLSPVVIYLVGVHSRLAILERESDKTLSSKVAILEKDSMKCEQRLTAYEMDIRKLEEKFLHTIDQLKDLMTATRIDTARAVSEMKHLNKSVLAVKAEEFSRFYGAENE